MSKMTWKVLDGLRGAGRDCLGKAQDAGQRQTRPGPGKVSMKPGQVPDCAKAGYEQMRMCGPAHALPGTTWTSGLRVAGSGSGRSRKRRPSQRRPGGAVSGASSVSGGGVRRAGARRHEALQPRRSLQRRAQGGAAEECARRVVLQLLPALQVRGWVAGWLGSGSGVKGQGSIWAPIPTSASGRLFPKLPFVCSSRPPQ